MKLKIKPLSEDFVLPKKAHDNDACFDLTAVSRKFNEEHQYYSYKFGFAADIPKGYCALIFPRSSISNTAMSLSNAVGVIDEGFKNEWSARFRDNGEGTIYTVGDRVAQFMLVPIIQTTIELTDELSDSSRGLGGYGSTNK